MSSNVRQKMVEGASQVLARRGLHATAFSEVLALTGASRGSIYHHFPGGKAELIEAVLEDHSARLDDELQALHGQPLQAVVSGALAIWRERLARADCDAGCPVAAVTVAADSNRMLQDCGQAFGQWTATLSAALRAAGLDQATAENFAALLVAAVQGGILLARARGEMTPFDAVAAQLMAQADELKRSS